MQTVTKNVPKPLNSSRLQILYAFWATLGLFWFLFQCYVLAQWISGPNFTAVNPGSDPISSAMQHYLLAAQILCPLLCLVCLWYWVFKPWFKQGNLNSDGMIVLAVSTTWFWDFSPSVVVDQVLYNSHMFNRGSWGLHAWPGWVSPGGHLLPEPLFFVPPAYIVLIMSQVIFICWLMRKIKQRFPAAGAGAFITAIILGLFVTDSIVEAAFLRTGLYAYPAAIRAITLFPGETYQFPLSEGFLFGGLTLGAVGILKFFKDDRGYTFVEKGVEQAKIPYRTRQVFRLASIYGFVHSAFFILYMLPAAMIAVNGDHYPEGYPSYLTNGMCLYGHDGQSCPGPGISIPRPDRNTE